MKHKTPFIITFLLLTAFTFERKNLSEKDQLSSETVLANEYQDILKNMISKMDSMTMTGDPDYDFAMMMMTHHQAAMDMNDILLKNGTEKELQILARRMNAEQGMENRNLKKFLQNHKTDTVNKTFNEQIKAAVKKMSEKISSARVKGNYDYDYASLMIPHHEAALECADLLMQYGTDPDLKKKTRKMKDKQERELESLKEWIDKNK